MNRKLALVSVIILAMPLFSMEATYSNSLTPFLDNWLDPKILSSTLKTQTVRKILEDQRIAPIPCANNEDWGLSFSPTVFDYIPLNMVTQTSKKRNGRVSVVDLGAGLGYMSFNYVLAGGKVDVVEMQRGAAVDANNYIFNNLRKLGFTGIGNNFHRVFPHNVLKVDTENNWTKTKHYLAVANNLVHFLSPEQERELARLIYDNLEDDGVVAVSSDTPFIESSWQNYYAARQSEAAGAKGYGVYSKSNGATPRVLGNPVPVGNDVVPGKYYPGHYLAEDNVVEKDSAYHTVKNYHLKEDLATVFTDAGFRLKIAYYVDGAGQLVRDESTMRVGNFYRAYALFIKDPQ